MNGREIAMTGNGRQIFVASYLQEEAKVQLRQQFPEAGTDYMGGHSDGYEYRSVFSGVNLAQSYEMIRAFLQEEGYGDVPIPKDVQELELFRLPVRNKQILLFEDNGYVHNPVKILFPADRRKKSTIILCLYNVEDSRHLIKFHRIDERHPNQMG